LFLNKTTPVSAAGDPVHVETTNLTSSHYFYQHTCLEVVSVADGW